MFSRVNNCATCFTVCSLCQWMFNTQLWSSGSANGGCFMISDKAVCKLHLNMPYKAHQERVKLHHNDTACSSSSLSEQWHFQFKEPSHCSSLMPRTMTLPLWPTTSMGLITLSPQIAPATRLSTLLSSHPNGGINFLYMCEQQKSPFQNLWLAKNILKTEFWYFCLWNI